MKNKTYHKKKILVVFTCAFLILTGLIGRLVYLMVFDAEYYQKRAEDLHKRERKIKAARGEIVDLMVTCWNLAKQKKFKIIKKSLKVYKRIEWKGRLLETV